MTISELFVEFGLTKETIDQLMADISLYNFQHPETPMILLDLTANIDTILLSQTPMIGRALGRERGRIFLDDEGKHPLHFDANAMRYACLQMEKYKKF